MSLFLTKDIADALCTVITLGFMQNNSKAVSGNQKTEFQYSDSDPAKIQAHKDLADSIKAKLGCEIAITQAASQSEMPCIVAKTESIWNISMAQKQVITDFWGYITRIASQAKEKNTAPFGAYIGVMSTISTLNIIGPSALEPYDRKYRIDSDGVAKNYENARFQAAAAVGILDKITPLPDNVKIVYDKAYYSEQPVPIKPEQLFHSYHGMIRAMVAKYPPIKDDVYLEIALGVNTSKVSSCIPCSIFMSANDMPATSTHLGRGDNWSIPSSSSSTTAGLLRQNWVNAVNCHYKKGLDLCKDQFPKIKVMKTALSGYTSVIPDVFLEALTFEAPFLERMQRTLGI
jgi:hypothetical protein